MCEMRGWLNGLIEGTCELDEVDSLIEKKINEALDTGYKHGVIDGRKERHNKLVSEVLGRSTRRDLTPLGINTLPQKEQALKKLFIEEVKSEFAWVAEKQEEKGIKKYGHELRPLDDYDWLEMAKEELVDAFKYLECERIKRARRD